MDLTLSAFSPSTRIKACIALLLIGSALCSCKPPVSPDSPKKDDASSPGGNSQTAPLAVAPDTPPRGVDGLPLDRFDEYLSGSIPPRPWQTIGTFAPGYAQGPGVTLSLQPAGESPFIDNKISGKGLVLQDSDPASGQGCGIEYSFGAIPIGRVFLAFDFKLLPDGASGAGLDFICQLLDENKQGLILRAGHNGELGIGRNNGELKTIAMLKDDVWYHIGIEISAEGDSTVYLRNEQQPQKERKLEVFSAGERFDFRTVRFSSDSPNAATGGWALDNIYMAGEVDTPRTAWLPFRQMPAEKLRESDRKVYAYYYYVYPSSYSNQDPSLSGYTRKLFNPSTIREEARRDAGTETLYRPLPRVRMEAGESATNDEVLSLAMDEEIRMAIRMGLDGFFTDFTAVPNERVGQVEFNRRSFALMDAASRVDPQFKVIPAIYAPLATSISPTTGRDETIDAFVNSPEVRKALTHPAALRLSDGRTVFSMWGAHRKSADWWGEVIKRLDDSGIPVAFFGQFNGKDDAFLAPYASISYGMADWGPRSPIPYDWIRRAKRMNQVVASPVCFQDVRTRDCKYWESQNSDLFRRLWGTAITEKSDWVFINTWSDYSEQAQAPSTSIGHALYDLNSYYIQWFKTGQQPEIVRDVIYYSYRTNHTDIVPAKGKPWKAMVENGVPKQDEIELLGFLKAPGTLKIQVGSQTYTRKAPAGITSFKVPLPPKTSLPPPVFSIVRGEETIVSGAGNFPILDQVEYANMLYRAGVITND